MATTLPLDYIFVLLVGSVLSAMLTERPRTVLLRRVHGAGARIIAGLGGWLPGHAGGSTLRAGTVTVLALLAMRWALHGLLARP